MNALRDYRNKKAATVAAAAAAATVATSTPSSARASDTSGASRRSDSDSAPYRPYNNAPPAPVHNTGPQYVPVPVQQDNSGAFMMGTAMGMMMGHNDSHRDHDDAPARAQAAPAPEPAPAPTVSAPPAPPPIVSGPSLDASANAALDHGQGASGDSFFLVILLIAMMILATFAVLYFMAGRKKRRDELRQKYGQDQRDFLHRSDNDIVGMDGKEVASAVRERMMGTWGWPRTLRLGSSFAVPASAFISDPDAAVPLHANPAIFDGDSSNLAIMKIANQYGQPLFDLYPNTSEREFLRVQIEKAYNAGTDAPYRVTEARFFSYIDIITPTSSNEWDDWLDDDRGMIGMPSFTTPDGVEWSRVIPGDSRITPQKRSERSMSETGAENLFVTEMLYARNTGYAAGFPQEEFLLLRLVESNNEAVIEVHAGVDLSVPSLKLML